jgi:signal transduction histidine kinase
MEVSQQPRRPILVVVVAAVAAIVGILGVAQAVAWYGHSFADVLVDRDACVSGMGSPGWAAARNGLRFPERVVEVDGVDLTPQKEYAARGFDRAVEAAAAAGRPSVHVKVLTTAGPRELDLPVGRFGAVEWWLLAGVLHFAGVLYVIVALTALVASPKGKLARTFAKTAILCAVFLFLLFESHTTRALIPLFDVAFALVPFSFIALALRLPDDAPLLRRAPWLVGALDLAGLAFALALLALNAGHQLTVGLRSFGSILFASAQVFFAVTFLVRFLRARGERRAVMRALVMAVAPPHLLLAAAVFLSMLSAKSSSAAFFVCMPVLTLTPLSAVAAFIRHDLWGSRALVSRVVTLAAGGIVACTVAIMLGAAFAASLGIRFRDALIAAAAGALASTGLVTLAVRAVDRRFFPSRTEYKPTIDRLSENLTALNRPQEVSAAVERMVKQWLACEYVRLEPGDADPAPAGDGDLLLPVTFGGARAATLRIGKKRGGALFTSDDVDLLRTIANQAALALAYALSYGELEERRRQQAAAWRGERAALVETLAAEIVHEVRYPINFFRSVFERRNGASSLDEEEVEIGCEEVNRLERLVAGLKRLGQPRLERHDAALRDLVARTELLLRDALGARTLEIEIAESPVLRCDADQVTQVLVNLVANALEACGDRGRVGIRFTRVQGEALVVVWDTGAGFQGDPAQLFAPWFTTKPRGTGLGLAITQRIVRAHGWRIDARRDGGRTEFVVAVPLADVVDASDGSDQHLVASAQSPAASAMRSA